MKSLSELINTFHLTVDAEKENVDSKSKIWEHINANNYNNINEDNLINFRKNRVLSNHLDDAFKLKHDLHLFKLLKRFDGIFLRNNLPKKNIGNCDNSINLIGYHFDYGILHHLEWYRKVQQYIQNNFFILEIGGGFGSLARIIIKNKNVKYFLVDLAQANLLTNYYLQSHFPQKKIFNFSDYKKFKLEEVIKDYDIFILPPNILENHDIKFNFIINSRSFMEMKKKTIKKYFDLIHKKITNDGYFLNINRYSKKVSESEKINFCEYPYDGLWNVIISEESFLQKGTHFLLTQRQNFIGNLDKEMLKLKNQKVVKHNSLFNLYYLTKHEIKKLLYSIIKLILTTLFSKKILIKISEIVSKISETR